MYPSSLIVLDNGTALAAQAAEFIARAAREAVQERGRFMLALAGGKTPEETYRHLAEPQQVSAMPWENTHLFFGDERFVPPDDQRSNFATVRRTLLAGVPIPASQVHSVPTTLGSAAEAAAAYSEELAQHFTGCEHAPPRFDLILLGLGEDGHTAGLFPHAPVLRITNEWVTWSPPGKLPPPVDRITFTYPVLNASRSVLFLVCGAKKAAVLRDVLEERRRPAQRPAAGVKPQRGSLTWMVDEEAAQMLTCRA